MERNIAAIRTSGTSVSNNNEGDFIGVTNRFSWDKGWYRVRLFKNGYTKGQPVPDNFTRNDVMFTWGKYEHTWVTLEVENLQTNEKVNIGSLAFPGRNLRHSARDIIFLEQYGTAIYFSTQKPQYPYAIMSYKDLPDLKLNIENICVNGKSIRPISVVTHHNYTCNPNQVKIAMPVPLLSKASYNEAIGVYEYEIGNLLAWQVPQKLR